MLKTLFEKVKAQVNSLLDFAFGPAPVAKQEEPVAAAKPAKRGKKKKNG